MELKINPLFFPGDCSHRTNSVQHILVMEDGKRKWIVSLDQFRYSIGRHPTNEIVIDSKHISRRHATLIRKTNFSNELSYWIFDGNLEGAKSHNGIFVNGEKCLISELKNGDVITFGAEITASYHVIEGNQEDMNLILNNPTIFSQFFQDLIPNSKVMQIQSNQNILTDSNGNSNIFFKQQLDLVIKASSNYSQNLSILFLKLELLNNPHKPIDELCLEAFVQYLSKNIRSEDKVIYSDNQDFLVIFPHLVDREHIKKVYERILQEFQSPFPVGKKQICLKIFGGIAHYPQDGTDAKALLEKARNNLISHSYSPQLPPLIVTPNKSQLSRIQTILTQALHRQEFELYYQPQINIRTKRIDSMEALLRWQHPELGLIPPSQCIPWAEQTNMIIPLSRWVLETACQQGYIWKQAGLLSFPIAVNIAPGQFKNSDLVNLLTEILAETKLEANLLELEVTQQSLLHNLERSLSMLKSLQYIGVKISMDDCGVGDFALSYLRQLPIQKLKIAQSLITKLPTHPEHQQMIAAVIASGRAFNLDVVAEGVETQSHFEILRSLNCEQMQGYCFSRPLNAQEATEFLAFHRQENI